MNMYVSFYFRLVQANVIYRPKMKRFLSVKKKLLALSATDPSQFMILMAIMSPYKFTSKTHSLSTEDLGKIFIDSFIHLSTRWEPFYLCKRPLQARQGRVLPFAMEIVFMVLFLQC